MCATNAFGMELIKNVRFVIISLGIIPRKSISRKQGRLEEMGLVLSSCILLFRFPDRAKLLKHISVIENDAHKLSAKIRLDEITKYCIEKKCKKQIMMQYFGDVSSVSVCKMCDVCLASY